jgi:hypothetical protein
MWRIWAFCGLERKGDYEDEKWMWGSFHYMRIRSFRYERTLL